MPRRQPAIQAGQGGKGLAGRAGRRGQGVLRALRQGDRELRCATRHLLQHHRRARRAQGSARPEERRHLPGGARRALALEQKLTQTSTRERIERLKELGLFDQEFATNLAEAYNFLLGLRLHARLAKLSRSNRSTTSSDPSILNKFERTCSRTPWSSSISSGIWFATISI